jgi:hypothetical protein
MLYKPFEKRKDWEILAIGFITTVEVKKANKYDLYSHSN